MTITMVAVAGFTIGGLAVIGITLLVALAYVHALLEEERVEHARTRANLDAYQRGQEEMARRQLALRPAPAPLSLGTPDVLEFDAAGIDSIIGLPDGSVGPPAATRIDRRPEGRR